MNRNAAKQNAIKRNSLIDLFRLVCAFLVVIIHIPLQGRVFADVILPLTRVAVPFFFMVAGYFLADENMERMKQQLNKQIRHVFRLFAGAFLFYLVFHILLAALQSPNGLKTYLSGLWNWKNWAQLIAINDPKAFRAEHLWYLAALLYGMAAIRLALKYFALKKIYWVGAVLGLLLVPLLIWQKSPYGEHIPLAMFRNFLFTGIPCLLVGVWIKCNTQRILKWPRKLVAFMPIAFVLLSIIERRLIYSWLDMIHLATFFSSLLLAASMIVLSIHFPSAGARVPFSKWGAKYSQMIYISHIFFIYILDAIAKSWRIQDALWYQLSLLFVIVVFLLSLGFAAVWEGAKNKLKQRK